MTPRVWIASVRERRSVTVPQLGNAAQEDVRVGSQACFTLTDETAHIDVPGFHRLIQAVDLGRREPRQIFQPPE